MHTLLTAVVFLCSLAIAGPAAAAGLRVVPLKLQMTAKAGAATLELTNLTSDNMGVQIEAKAWSQAAGADVYADTQDLLFAPPIIAIPAGKTKTVRFRLRRGAAVDREQSYRVYVQQLAATPDNASDPNALAGGVSVRLRLGLPLFVAAITPQQPGLEATSLKLPDGRSALRLKNPGGVHLKIAQVEVVDAQGQVVAETRLTDTQTNYLLPAAESTWPLHRPKAEGGMTLLPGRYSLRVQTDFYTQRGAAGFSREGFATRSIDVSP